MLARTAKPPFERVDAGVILPRSAAWWQKACLDLVASARVLWLNTHPLPAISEKTDKPTISIVPVGGDWTNPKRGRLSEIEARYKTKPILRATG
jgi:hypothetical protein